MDGSVDGESSGDAELAARQCALCKCDITNPSDAVLLRKQIVHKWCSGGRRFVRDRAKARGCQKEVDAYESQCSAQFGARLLDLDQACGASTPGQRRSSLHRHIVDAVIDEILTFQTRKEVDETLYLGEAAFIYWHQTQLGYTEEAARSLWAKRLGRPTSGVRIHRGVEKLPVDGHLKLVSEKGVTHHRITTATHSASFNESMADAARAASQNVFNKDGRQRGIAPFQTRVGDRVVHAVATRLAVTVGAASLADLFRGVAVAVAKTGASVAARLRAAPRSQGNSIGSFDPATSAT